MEPSIKREVRGRDCCCGCGCCTGAAAVVSAEADGPSPLVCDIVGGGGGGYVGGLGAAFDSDVEDIVLA